jgi:hypothetical protein
MHEFLCALGVLSFVFVAQVAGLLEKRGQETSGALGLYQV